MLIFFITLCLHMPTPLVMAKYSPQLLNKNLKPKIEEKESLGRGFSKSSLKPQ